MTDFTTSCCVRLHFRRCAEEEGPSAALALAENQIREIVRLATEAARQFGLEVDGHVDYLMAYESGD